MLFCSFTWGGNFYEGPEPRVWMSSTDCDAPRICSKGAVLDIELGNKVPVLLFATDTLSWICQRTVVETKYHTLKPYPIWCQPWTKFIHHFATFFWLTSIGMSDAKVAQYPFKIAYPCRQKIQKQRYWLLYDITMIQVLDKTSDDLQRYT